MNYFFHTYITGCSNTKSNIPFLTKFEVLKLKIDAFNIFVILLSSLPKNLWINSFVEQCVDQPLVIRKCIIPLLTKFTTMKLNIDVFSVSMIFL